MLILRDSRVSGTIRSPHHEAYVEQTVTKSERTRVAKELGEVNLGMPRRVQVLKRAGSQGTDHLQMKYVKIRRPNVW